MARNFLIGIDSEHKGVIQLINPILIFWINLKKVTDGNVKKQQVLYIIQEKLRRILIESKSIKKGILPLLNMALVNNRL